jgi:hypothetical protein
MHINIQLIGKNIAKTSIIKNWHDTRYPFKIMIRFDESIDNTTELGLALNKFRPERDHSQLNPDF